MYSQYAEYLNFASKKRLLVEKFGQDDHDEVKDKGERETEAEEEETSLNIIQNKGPHLGARLQLPLYVAGLHPVLRPHPRPGPPLPRLQAQHDTMNFFFQTVTANLYQPALHRATDEALELLRVREELVEIPAHTRELQNSSEQLRTNLTLVQRWLARCSSFRSPSRYLISICGITPFL